MKRYTSTAPQRPIELILAQQVTSAEAQFHLAGILCKTSPSAEHTALLVRAWDQLLQAEQLADRLQAQP